MEQEDKRMGESSPTGQTKSISQKEEMQMFNRKFKLIGTAIGLVAVLMALMALPGATQDNPFARPNIVRMLQNQFAALTATTEDLLDFEQAVWWSDGGPRLIAYIPPHPASGIWDRIRQSRSGEKVEVPLGGLYVAEDQTGLFKFPLPQALKLRARGDTVVFINSAGEEVMTRPVTVDLTTPLSELGEPGRPKFFAKIQYGGGFCVGLRIAGHEIIGLHATWET